jgi:predicted small metal-binding protein
MTGYKFKCKDIGMNCGFEVKGASSKDEMMQLVAAHAKGTHNMQTIPPEIAQKVSSAIKS